MNDTRAAGYRFNPAEDMLLRGDQLTEGMLVLAELNALRLPAAGTTEDDKLRAQRFRRVGNLGRKPARPMYGTPELITFTGTWIDGYQMTHTTSADMEWIVKRQSADDEVKAEARDLAGMVRDGYTRHAESAAALGLTPSEPGPVFETSEGGAFTVTRGGRTYTVTVTPTAEEAAR